MRIRTRHKELAQACLAHPAGRSQASFSTVITCVYASHLCTPQRRKPWLLLALCPGRMPGSGRTRSPQGRQLGAAHPGMLPASVAGSCAPLQPEAANYKVRPSKPVPVSPLRSCWSLTQQQLHQLTIARSEIGWQALTVCDRVVCVWAFSNAAMPDCTVYGGCARACRQPSAMPTAAPTAP